MIDTETSFIELIDKHLYHHNGFALCRLPGSSEPSLYVQTAEEPETLDNLTLINDKSGFLIAPYDTKEHPAILIKPDIIVNGKDNIISALSHLPTGDKITPEAQTTYNIGRDEYTLLLNLYIKTIKNGECQKLVFARSSESSLSHSAGEIFAEACRRYPKLFVYLYFTRRTGLWIGSTPEMLVEGRGNRWRTMALAGTQKLSDKIVWDKKNKAEQRIVEEFIMTELKSISTRMIIDGPYTCEAANLAHLRTDIEVVTPQTTGIGDIAELLHPTPAVCGMPRETARQYIQRNEPTRRLYYAGLVGPIDPQAEIHLYVNLRCMSISGNKATIFAGGGIMADSQCESEWDETEMKIATIGDLTNR